MHARVTAVLVASNGGEHLPRTLEALAAQTRRPDTIIVVDCASTDDTQSLLAKSKPDHFIQASGRLSFGTAIDHALGVVAPPEHQDEWLWLLAHDTAPEPDALAALLAAVEVNPSVAAAGPKQMEWDDTAYLAAFGETVTRFGASVQLTEIELDQAQHDRMSDVLGMGAAGLLVRHRVWNELGGFDPALPTADNALDFSIRVRLAGHRVLAVPAARVATDGDGLSGPGRSQKGSARRRRQAAARAAQLHRRLVYAPGAAVALLWLSLVPLAVVRALFQLVRKQPGAVGGEFSAAFRTAFGSHIGEARRRLKAAKRVGWSAIAPLRMPGDEVRRRRSLQREIALTYLRGDRDRIQFIASGGLATVLVMALVGFVLFIPLFGAAALLGGGALPLSSDAGSLWAQIGVGFRDIGLGFTGAADPFAAVLAVLGSITFWSPSFVLVCLYLVTLPLAALAAWFCAAALTDRPLARTTAAVLWAIAPPLLSGLDAGMIGPVIAHLLLPWLVLAALSAPRSWSASGMAAILFAAVAAAAPSLWPALLVMWVAATIASRRDVARLIGIPIPALVLFAPLAYDQWMRGTPLALLADPGVPVWRDPAGAVDLLLGLPQRGLSGWVDLAGQVGISSTLVGIIAVVLIVPLALTALVALFLPRSYAALASIGIAILGLGTALLAGQLQLATSGSHSVAIWSGSGLSLYWLGMVGAAVLALHSLRSFAAVPAVIGSVAIGVLVLPLGLGVLLGTAEVVPGSGRQMPAFVVAEAIANPRVGTLVLSPQADGGLAASVVHGAGPTLDQQSTLASTSALSGAGSDTLDELVGNAASISGSDVSGELNALGIAFVLLQPVSAAESSTEAAATVARTSNALGSNPSLTLVGDTSVGGLWQVGSAQPLPSLPAPVPSNVGTPLGILVLVVQGAVFLIALLLALPAGRLQVQGGRAVSSTAHVAAAHSTAEAIAEDKTSEYDDDEVAGDEPEMLDEVRADEETPVREVPVGTIVGGSGFVPVEPPAPTAPATTGAAAASTAAAPAGPVILVEDERPAPDSVVEVPSESGPAAEEVDVVVLADPGSAEDAVVAPAPGPADARGADGGVSDARISDARVSDAESADADSDSAASDAAGSDASASPVAQPVAPTPDLEEPAAADDASPAGATDPGYDPDDETVLSVRDAIARHDAQRRGDDDAR
ncbi:hypothetical protein GCM10010988_11400 [Cnuibacter physcomitrellae]|uniref:Uncharacterized protein n=1 Tax=Cnuibacter physcomitrellae TaxID=1619308 RepID=A0A1X9LNX7_9MICO|nr:glycosyltransferase family 2 protein [Cnuibacter physcomitrellae]ARJ05978.1 hypothetical protein B5808_12650 [Cnuibacter physcomitrellae]GGI36928.1 hypothetical protein GCM10010988_11400 [Cnuibacter physcomitrellae]